MRTCAMIAALLAGFAATAAAGEPTPVALPEPLPVPDLAVQPVYRINRYAGWQNYAVDRRGYFRPRVILTPDGDAFYYINGEPFPWFNAHPLDFMPHASN